MVAGAGGTGVVVLAVLVTRDSRGQRATAKAITQNAPKNPSNTHDRTVDRRSDGVVAMSSIATLRRRQPATG